MLHLYGALLSVTHLPREIVIMLDPIKLPKLYLGPVGSPFRVRFIYFFSIIA